MEDRYVIENNGRKIVFLRPHHNISIQIRLEPGDIYTDLYDLEENDINYYRQLAKNGLHLMSYENYLRKEGRTDELKEYLADDEEVEEEEKVEEPVEEEVQQDDSEEEPQKEINEEDNTEKEEEEVKEEVKEVDETVEEEQQDEQDESEEEDKYADITENKLKEMEEDEVRDLAEELGVGNYWNKKIDNLAKDILTKLKE